MLREKWDAMKHVVLFYYIFVLLVFVVFAFFVPLDVSMDKTIRVILVVYFLVFPVVMFYTLRYALHVFLFSLAFITGFYGFYHHSIDDHSITNALYFTFRLYLLDLAEVFTQDGSSPNRYPILLEIARWTAASYTITTIFIAMYRTLGREISLFFAQTIGKHHIVFSYNEKSHHFIQDLRDHGERVIVVDEKLSAETENMLNAMDVIVIQAPINDANIFHVTGAKRAKSISLFHEKDQDSLYVLMSLEKYVRAKQLSLNVKKLIIHLEDNRYQAELMSFLQNVEHFSFPVEVINVYEAVAKQFWHNHEAIFAGDVTDGVRLSDAPSSMPVSDAATVDAATDVHLLVIGYDSFGKQLVMEAEKCNERVGVMQDFSITVFDAFPVSDIAGRVRFVPFNSDTDELTAVIDAQEKVFTHMFICLDEDYIDLMEGIELSEYYRTTPIYMNIKDENIEQTFMITSTATEKTLYSTGVIQSVLTMEYLDV